MAMISCVVLMGLVVILEPKPLRKPFWPQQAGNGLLMMFELVDD